MSKIAANIDRMNLVNFGSATVAFFDFTIGVQTDDGQFVPVVKVKDNSLNTSNKDDSLWVSYPSKLRMKNGQAVQENGKNKYDAVVDTVVEQVDGKWQSTDASFKFKNYIAGLATAKYNELSTESSGRGAPRPAAAAAAAPQRAAPQRPVAAAPAVATAPGRTARAAAAPTLESDDGFDLF